MKRRRNRVRQIVSACLIALGICAVGILTGLLSEWSVSSAPDTHGGADSASAAEGSVSVAEGSVSAAEGSISVAEGSLSAAEDGAAGAPDGAAGQENGTEALEVTFFDVGQGDAALLVCGGHAAMIDGGGRSTSSFIVASLKEMGITSLDCLILSHFDEDHIAGAIGVLYTAEVGCVVEAGYEADTEICRSLKRAEESAGVPVRTAVCGETFPLGGAAIRIVAPASYDHETENDNSVCLMVEYGEDRILFMGDAESAEEEELLNRGEPLGAQILKVGHHGSGSSSGEAFLAAVDPEYAVISCGRDNPYGHPSAQVLERLEKRGTAVFRTDEAQTVRFRSEGAGFFPLENAN